MEEETHLRHSPGHMVRAVHVCVRYCLSIRDAKASICIRGVCKRASRQLKENSCSRPTAVPAICFLRVKFNTPSAHPSWMHIMSSVGCTVYLYFKVSFPSETFSRVIFPH